MSFFYDLNKKLNGIGTEKKLVESKETPKTPARQTLEQALRADLKNLMEDGTGGMNFSGSGSLEEGNWDDAPRELVSGSDLGIKGNLSPYYHHTIAKYLKQNGLRSVKQFGSEDIDMLSSKLGCSMENLADLVDFDSGLDEAETKSYSAKKAAAGKDIGKPGKNFAKIAKSAGKKYGSKAAGERVAGAVLNKLRHANEDGGSEMECNDPVPSKGIPGNIPVKGKMDRLRGKRDFYEADIEWDADNFDQTCNVGDMLHDTALGDVEVLAITARDVNNQPAELVIRTQDGKKKKVQWDELSGLEMDEDAVAMPYNKGTGKPDAHNGLEFEGNAFTGKLKSTPKGGKFDLDGKEYTDTSELDETMTRQHFQHTAELLKHIEDPAKRMELAKHHAGIFKASNPRFDHAKFMKACGVEEGLVGATLGGIAGAAVGGPVGAVRGAMAGNAIGNAISPDESEVDEGFADMDAWLAQREKEKGTGKFDKRKVSTGTVYTRRFDDEPEDNDTDAPANKGGKPRGRGRPVGTKRATGARGPTGKSKLMAKGSVREEDQETDEGWRGGMHGEPAMVKTRQKIGDTPQEQAYEDLMGFIDGQLTRGLMEPNIAKHLRKLVLQLKPAKEVAEKAVSKKQQKFMGMVHAAQKGEKAASPEVAKVAKGMTKKAAHDFAATKHKGLPEKVKAKKNEDAKPDYIDLDKDGDKKESMKKAAKDAKKEKKVDETTTSGSVATASEAPKSSKGGMSFGGGIYDSWNRDIETMISESQEMNDELWRNTQIVKQWAKRNGIQGDMNTILAAMSHEGSEGDSLSHSEYIALDCLEKSLMSEHAVDGDEESITVTATGADVHRLKELLSAMGIEQPQHGVEHSDAPCHSCGGVPCQCDELAEADAPVDENSPDYPTNQEESDDALQYSGGLNGKKSTGQSTVPVLASQEERQVSESNSFFDLYKVFSKIAK